MTDTNATEVYDDEGNCVLVKWPMADYPTEENSVTAGKTREEIVAWIGGDAARALVVLREESDKFDSADVDLLWDCQQILTPGLVRPA